MARPYNLKRRAEKMADTRLRIVEAAIALHGSVGPAQTTLSMVADRAGVQRHTLYAHFPDERALLEACSGLSLARDPLPDPAAWRDIPAGEARLRAGLAAVYGWYARNADLAGCVLRDAESHAPVREIVERRMGPVMAAQQAILGVGLTGRQRAMLALALSFFTWRTLTREAGLKQPAAIAAMTGAILGAR